MGNHMGLNTHYEFPFGPHLNPWLAAGRINSHAVMLLTQRAQAYLNFSAELGECKTTDDVLTQQVSFWQIAQRQYLETVQKSILATLPVLGMAPTSETVVQKGRPRDYMVVQQVAPDVIKSGSDHVGKKPSGVELAVPSERLRRTA